MRRDDRARAAVAEIIGERPRTNQGDATMRFMMIVKANADSEAGVMPGRDLLIAMGKFNEEMIKAGVMLDGAGLQSSAKGARVIFKDDKRTVVDGPFAETKELIAGFWVIQVKSKEEAVAWALRVPHPHTSGETNIEIRPFFEPTDFPDAPPELVERELEFERHKRSGH
jgi:hypothetical protein